MPPLNKEAVTIIIDIGKSVNTKDDKDEVSFFKKTTSTVFRIIERKIFSRPDDFVSLILMGTEQSNNSLHIERGHFENISIATAFETPSWKLLKLISSKIKPSEYNTNWIDAVLVACDYMDKETTSMKVSNRKIVLFTDLKTASTRNEAKLQEVSNTLKMSKIELIVIGPDLWMDEECSEPSQFLFNKSKSLQDNESLIKKVIFETNGIFCSFEECMSLLQFHKKKATNPYPWNVDLSIGPSIKIPISGYGKIRACKAFDWKRGYKSQDKKEMSAIAQQVTYIKSDDTPDDEKTVSKLNIIKSYVHGDALVPFTDADSATMYQCGEKCLSIYGFTGSERVHLNHLQGDGITYVVSRKDDPNANAALNALIIAMKNLDQVAIARKVYCNNRGLTMVVLFPIIEEDYKCLGMINLAYKDDFTNMMFPPLDTKRVNVTDEQTKAVKALINSMDLDTGNEDNSESFPIGETPNPYLQYMFDILSYRALSKDESLPPPRQEIVDLLEVPLKIRKLAEEPLQRLKKCFDLKDVEKHADKKPWRIRKTQNDDLTDPQPSTSNNGVSEVRIKPIMKISTVQPSDDFKAMIASGEPLSLVFPQIVSVIENIVLMAIGDDFTKALTAVTAVREECVFENPNIYNKWLCDLKVILLQRYKSAFLSQLIENNLTLITTEENSNSLCNNLDVKKFSDFSDDQSISKVNLVSNPAFDDLFDD